MPLRIAIVGFGPKGLFALERLLDHLPDPAASTAVEVDLFEPHPTPAAGPVYDPGQPDYLRMNFAAEQVDIWPPQSRAVAASERLSFAEWRKAQGDPSNEEYPPRAQVGRYLVAGYESLRAHAADKATIELRPAAVRSIRRERTGWEVATGESAGIYDEVLVAVGHQAASDQGLAAAWPHPAPLVPAVFGVERWLGRERISPGSTVALRGFALTFIDATLALTEGRGASFEETAHPYRLAYSPCADEAGVLLPFSRSGRPMLAKPSPQMATSLPELEAIAEPARQRVLALGDRFTVETDLIAIIDAVADASLRAAGGVRAGPAADPYTEIEHSLAIATGVEPPDTQWAQGQAWRALYPALVARLGGEGLDEGQWPAFGALSARMERIAFGPPVVNAAKLLAMVDAGRVDLSHARGRISSSASATSIVSAAGERAVDVVVDAVLPGPGAAGLHSELLEQLVADRHARIAPGRRGLDVSEDGSCIGADGKPSCGLSAIGRPTEDSVIGNDTLSRALHPHADLWARRVVRSSDAVAGSGAGVS